jgi:hypothetical protein
VSGFAGLPAGYRRGTTALGVIDGRFVNFLSNGIFWSATPKDPTSVWYRYLLDNSGSLGINSFVNNKSYGYSVRLIKD